CATVGNYENLYSHDGVAQPVKLMDDFFIHESIIYDQELYLVRSNNFNGKTGLYKMSNALSTTVLIDESYSISDLQVVNNRLIFVAHVKEQTGTELYTYDKATGKTNLVID